MTSAARNAALRVALVIATSIGGFVLMQKPARALEAGAAGSLLHLFGARNLFVLGDSVQVYPAGHEAFRAIVTPSCSALSSLLALLCLAALVPRRFGRRRYLAAAAALATVAAGNLVRITSSIAVGLAAGPASLVLFHDWVGSVFTFVYTLGGYILMLYLLLPRGHARVSWHGGLRAA